MYMNGMEWICYFYYVPWAILSVPKKNLKFFWSHFGKNKKPFFYPFVMRKSLDTKIEFFAQKIIQLIWDIKKSAIL